jgi:adenylate cyclase
MAVWNAPVSVQGHSERALEAALEMQRQVDNLSKTDEFWIAALQAVHKAKLRVRMGLHTGNALCGNLGAQKRMKYGLLGDVISISSALEDLNKKYGTNILITEDIYLAPAVNEKFQCRIMDKVKVKGTAGIKIFEVMGLAEDVQEYQTILCNLHEAAFKLYMSSFFVDAAKLLRRAEEISLLAGMPSKGSEMLRKKASHLAEYFPDELMQNWNGVFEGQHN